MRAAHKLQRILNNHGRLHCSTSVTNANISPSTLTILGQSFPIDAWTNVTPRVLSKVGTNLHNQKYHPLCLIRQRIQNFFYTKFLNKSGNPLFAVFDNIKPTVTTYQNFDSLLVAKDHPSRSRSDTYYINETHLLRAHTSAHEEELIRMGFDSFLNIGEVFRRDEIDATHYPVFHQFEGVRLFTEQEIFSKVKDRTGLRIFEEGKRRTPEKQEVHSLEAAKLVEHELKHTLLGLAHSLFGPDVESRWVDVYFPFTHPSWELEIKFQGDWLEVLGSGILEHQILCNAGAQNKIGWAFGMGLDRLAMKLYNIPDIRLFWSKDEAFLSQFHVDNPETPITYKPISKYPACTNDISFWIPADYASNDFYDLVRTVGGDLVEKVSLVDNFTHPKHQRQSHCYRITYRHMDKTFTQDEVNVIHKKVEEAARDQLGIELR